MRRFREHISGKIVTVFTAVMFLNMSFLLAEVRLLGIDKDATFSRIISLIISGTCFEEEKETGGDTSEEGPSKKIDMAFHYQFPWCNAYTVLSALKWAREHSMLVSQTFETFTPPPES